MGKRTKTRRRGRGTPVYRTNRLNFQNRAMNPKQLGEVTDIIHDSARTAPVARILLEKGRAMNVIASANMKVGDCVESKMLSEYPEGSFIYNIESMPGDGGKFVRAGGTFAKIITQGVGKTIVQLPSKAIKEFNSKCSALLGKVAGSGHKEKPFVKAGAKYFHKKARGKKHPRVSGTAMNPCNHPHGGKTKPGTPTCVKRTTPPGRKVGSIAPRRTGRKKK